MLTILDRAKKEGTCPVCGAKVTLTGLAKYRRVVGSCGDAFFIGKWQKEVPITVDEEKRMVYALKRTWDAIAYDLLESNGGKAMPRSHVIECVLDADHPRTYGISHVNDEEKAADKAAVDLMYDLPDKQLQAICKKAFPFGYYGM